MGNERNHMDSQTVTAEEQPFLTSGMTGIGGRIKVSPEVEKRLFFCCDRFESIWLRSFPMTRLFAQERGGHGHDIL